jgi:hypothetical protein
MMGRLVIENCAIVRQRRMRNSSADEIQRPCPAWNDFAALFSHGSPLARL